MIDFYIKKKNSFSKCLFSFLSNLKYLETEWKIKMIKKNLIKIVSWYIHMLFWLEFLVYITWNMKIESGHLYILLDEE